MQRFLIIVRNDGAVPSPQNLSEASTVLGKFAVKKPGLVFSSPDGMVVGLTIKSDKDAAQIRSTLESVISCKDRGFILVLSTGDDMSALGNSSGWRHLQH